MANKGLNKDWSVGKQLIKSSYPIVCNPGPSEREPFHKTFKPTLPTNHSHSPPRPKGQSEAG